MFSSDCCLSGSGTTKATKVAGDMDETLPLENPGEAFQAAKDAEESLEVPDTQPRPDLEDINDIFSKSMPHENWLPENGLGGKAWFGPNIDTQIQCGTCCKSYPLLCNHFSEITTKVCVLFLIAIGIGCTQVRLFVRFAFLPDPI